MNVTKYINAMADVVAEFERKAFRRRSISLVESSAEAARKAIQRIAKEGRRCLDERNRGEGMERASPWALKWSKPPTHPPKLQAKLAAAESITLEKIDEFVENCRIISRST